MKAVQVSLRHGTVENDNVTNLVAYVEKRGSLRVGSRIVLKNHRHADWWWHVENIDMDTVREAVDADWKISGSI